VRERDIEQYLVREAGRGGGRAYKWASPGQRGVPDRIVFMPGWERPAFVELKAPGKTPTKLQEKMLRELREYGQHVEVIDSRDGVDRLLRNRA